MAYVSSEELQQRLGRTSTPLSWSLGATFFSSVCCFTCPKPGAVGVDDNCVAMRCYPVHTIVARDRRVAVEWS